MKIRAIYSAFAAVFLTIAVSLTPAQMLAQLPNSKAHPATTTITPSAPITTIAGNGYDAGSENGGFSGDGGLATQAEMSFSTAGYVQGWQSNVGTAFDSAGNLYIPDTRNNRVRKVAAGTGIITTVAGGATITVNGTPLSACTTLAVSGDGGPATSACLSLPSSVAVDSSGNLYIADSLDASIRRVDASTGIITTVAGSYTCLTSSTCLPNTGYSGDGGPATTAQLSLPTSVIVDKAGNLYITDSNNAAIRKVAAGTGIITTIAGAGLGCALQTDNQGDGCPATNAVLGFPQALAFDANGNLYISDPNSDTTIRVVNAQTGIITGFSNAVAVPTGIAFDSSGNLYVGSQYDVVYQITPSGVATQVAGVFQTEGYYGTTASTALFEYPGALTFDTNGNLYISDTYNNVIRKVGFGSTPATTATTSTLTSDVNPQVLGASVTFTADVKPASGSATPGGSVTFSVDGAAGSTATLDSTGEATYKTSTLTTGQHTIKANYAGSSTFSSSSASLSETILGAAASVTVVSGSSQSTVYGSGFGNPLVVLAKDSNGNPVPDTVVTFSGSGLSFSSSTATTGSNGEATVAVTAVAAGSSVATASVSGVSGSANFTLTATKAMLTITANNITVSAGQAIPALTYTATGFVNGDSQAVLQGSPTETTTATKSSASGAYPITITQGTLLSTNYSFQFVNGTLTVGAESVTATPAISPAAGTYTSAQTITITDSTPGAVIYFTTDGSTPTPASTLYKAAITVSATETINAIAVANGYADSSLASAAYTINLPAADFGISLSPASLSVTAGNSGTTAVTITPQNGFGAAISFACSGQPGNTTCSFSPSTVTPGSSAASTTLTIATAAASAHLIPESKPLWPGAPLAASVLFLAGMRRKRKLLQNLTLALVCILTVGWLTGCGMSNSPGTTGGGTTPSTSSITVTATSGSLSHATTLTLTIN